VTVADRLFGPRAQHVTAYWGGLAL
jgi:hypothetical protein